MSFNITENHFPEFSRRSHIFAMQFEVGKLSLKYSQIKILKVLAQPRIKSVEDESSWQQSEIRVL